MLILNAAGIIYDLCLTEHQVPPHVPQHGECFQASENENVGTDIPKGITMSSTAFLFKLACNVTVHLPEILKQCYCFVLPEGFVQGNSF